MNFIFYSYQTLGQKEKPFEDIVTRTNLALVKKGDTNNIKPKLEIRKKTLISSLYNFKFHVWLKKRKKRILILFSIFFVSIKQGLKKIKKVIKKTLILFIYWTQISLGSNFFTTGSIAPVFFTPMERFLSDATPMEDFLAKTPEEQKVERIVDVCFGTGFIIYGTRKLKTAESAWQTTTGILGLSGGILLVANGIKPRPFIINNKSTICSLAGIGFSESVISRSINEAQKQIDSQDTSTYDLSDKVPKNHKE